jgi:hypothetical protein
MSFQWSALIVAVKSIERAKWEEWETCPENIDPFQPTKMPPEAPWDGTRANLLKRLGANCLTKDGSKEALLVS